MRCLIAWFILIQTSLFAAVLNGNFENGMDNWSIKHDWYAKPKDSGLSLISVVEKEGHNEGKVLKISGDGKRGLAMQLIPAFPGQYKISGWIKCQNLDTGHAGVLLEWMDTTNKWMRGDWAFKASGNKDWQRFETVVTAPPGTRSVHFDLITTEPNEGTVWFDDITINRIPSNTPPPVAPELTVVTSEGSSGALEVSWDPKTLVEGTVSLILHCDIKSLKHLENTAPRAVLDSATGKGKIEGLTNGKTYHVSVVAVDADGRNSPPGKIVKVKPYHRQTPRPGWVEAERQAGESLTRVSWSPHILNKNIKAIHISIPEKTSGKAMEIRVVKVTKILQQYRPFYCTEPWINVDIELSPEVSKVGVQAEDEDDLVGNIAWTEIRAAPPSVMLPCQFWMTPPTENIANSITKPVEAQQVFDLSLLQNQTKGFQVVLRPEQSLHKVRTRFEQLRHEDGKTEIDARWIAWHFVEYVQIEKNSRATPKKELVWPGPAEYPDELAADSIRDLAPGRTQPVFVRVTAPSKTKPGLYRGKGRIEADEGVCSFDFNIRIWPVELPEQPRLKFVYWFSWDDPCKCFGVGKFSSDGWRVLECIADLMRVHHQNSVVVPWDLVHSWRMANGKLVHDFSDFDRFIQTFQKHGVDQLFCLTHMGSRTTGEWECPTMGPHKYTIRKIESNEVEQVDVVEILPMLEQHIADLGLLNRFSVHVADEPTPKNVDSYRQFSARVKQAAPRLRRIDAIHVPNLQGSLEIWVPQLNYFEKWLDQYYTAQAAGNELWFYIAWVPQGTYPNRMIDSHAIKPRILHWLNALYGTTGYLHWALNRWSIPLSSLESPGDQYICWPGQRFIANSSLRYEAEREGLEDCEFLFMVRDALEKRGLSRTEANKRLFELARPAIQDIQNYTRSWRELENARETLILELIK
ncbi:MAG: DUF4091 domain-containing protein [Kiritimatiellae bacterium]|nr:DUF4091 domain-containing protein [Kiritimatiellia bacterium]MDD5520801.1 DUF4091 domain-containing protein [Kiritimatiellia bacterium]